MPPETADGVESAALFFVKRGGLADSNYGVWLPTTIRAVTLDGRELWSYTTPPPTLGAGNGSCTNCGEPVTHIAADNRGGVVMVIGKPTGSADHTVRRLDGATGAISWEYTAPGQLSEVAVHADGTVFAVENIDYSTNLLALDGDTGAVRARLTLDSSSNWNVGNPTAPLIRDDGSVNVAMFSYDTDTLRVFEVPDGTLSLTSQTINYPEKDGDGQRMASFVLHTPSTRLVPDGQGGLLLSAPVLHRVYRIANGALTGPADLGGSAPYWWGTSDVDYVIAEDGAYALTTRGLGATPTFRPADSVQYLVKFDPVTLGVAWSDTVFDSPDATLRFATVGGGVFYSGPNYNGNGQQVGPGVFASWNGAGGPTLQVADLAVPMWESSYPGGNEEHGNAPPAPVNVAVQFVQIDWDAVPLSATSPAPGVPSEVQVVKDTALATANEAYQGYRVKFIEYAGDRADKLQRHIYVKHDRLKGATGATYLGSRDSDVYFWTVESTLRDVVGCRTVTFGVCTAYSRQELVKALGRGLGAAAAHELGEQAGFYFTFDVSPTICPDCYDTSPATRFHFFGPLHWSDKAKERMDRLLR